MFFFHGLGDGKGSTDGGNGFGFEQMVMKWLVQQGEKIIAGGEQFCFIPQYKAGMARIDFLITRPFAVGIEVKYVKNTSMDGLKEQILKTRVNLARALKPRTPMILILPKGTGADTAGLAAKCVFFDTNLDLKSILDGLSEEVDSFMASFEDFLSKGEEVSDLESIEDMEASSKAIEEIFGSGINKNAVQLTNAIRENLSKKLDAEVEFVRKNRIEGVLEFELRKNGVQTQAVVLIDPDDEIVARLFFDAFKKYKQDCRRVIFLAFSRQHKLQKGSNWIYSLCKTCNDLEQAGYKVFLLNDKSVDEELSEVVFHEKR